jgi:hypothetical protein
MRSRYGRYILGIVATIVAIISTNESSAQEFGIYPEEERKVRTEMGIGVGATYTGLYNVASENIAMQPRVGIGAHFDFAVLFGNHFAIEAEVGYGGGSMNVSNGNIERRVRTRAVDIPLLLSARMANQRVRLSAGPMFTVLSSAEYSKDGEKLLFGPMHPTVNIAGGVGVVVGKYTLIEVRYVHPLKETLNQFEGTEFNTKAYRITLGLAISF